MHYYQFSIGDYTSETAHLDEMEDLAYRRMLDLYYSKESALVDDIEEIAKKIRMRSHCECIASVLNEFFVLEEDRLWHNERTDIEIFKFHEKSVKAAKSAKARWKKHKQNQKVSAKKERDANALRTHCEGNANQEPLTINQEPSTNKPKKDSVDFTIFEMCSDEQILEVKRIRKANAKKPKDGDFSQRIANTIAGEFRKALVIGWTVEEILNEWETRKWVSFKSEWIEPKFSNPSLETPEQTRRRNKAEVSRKLMDIHDTSW
jgi:uncharacterized protein YdaU (DUF1376 family)